MSPDFPNPTIKLKFALLGWKLVSRRTSVTKTRSSGQGI